MAKPVRSELPAWLERLTQLLDRVNDAEKLELCTEKCNELLHHHTGLQLLIAAYDDLMSGTCPGYESKIQEKTTRTSLPTARNKNVDNTDNFERDEWERYFSVATSAARVKSKCLVALKAVVKRWGRKVILHYEWASKGENFCNLLRAGAANVPKWDDAALALTIIMCRRHLTVKRPCIARSRDPITSADLKELKGLAVSGPLQDSILPVGFGLDKFGLVVHEDFAIPRHPNACGTKPPIESDQPSESSNSTSDAELSSSNTPETDCTEFPQPLAELSGTNAFDPPPRRSLRPSTQSSYKETPSRGLPGQSGSPADPPVRRRATSLPDIARPSKRQRVEDPSPSPPSCVSASDTTLSPGEEVDEGYRKQVLAELRETAHTLPPDSHAADIVDSVSPGSVPIITEGQQHFQWSEKERPITQLFRRMTHLDRTVSVQIPSRSATGESCEERTLGEFLDRRELCAERVVAPSNDWNQWKNVLEWVLLSEGGHQTAPHMDSNGVLTWITVQEGFIGFDWMARPTEEEERPGQTVFFPSGTIHFVFRTQVGQTLALGGHVLQWSGIERWMHVVLAEEANPMITNEKHGTKRTNVCPCYLETRRGQDSRRSDRRIRGGDATVKRFLAAVGVRSCLSQFENG
ncbi:hypothetical protein QBC35DRAFT_545237 [Podospora australis]|uniref:JmjC domain-containing protein n=1 Tax=Podospora australis TaxID=1536484 RepID=A0AAN7AEK5_9PEZI|nr:hypothetical protein QBC35DRAFT_545237 [Podospora australis]